MKDLQNPLDILVSGLFDYSGMFPPESKSFEGALFDSARFETTLVRPFLVNTDLVLQRASIDLLSEDVLKAQGFQDGQKIRIAYLGSDIVTPSDIERAIEEVQFVHSWNGTHSKDAVQPHIVSYEVKIAQGVTSLPSDLLTAAQSAGIILCVEPDLSITEWRSVLNHRVGEIARCEGVSLKIRGTGPAGIGTEKMAVVIDTIAQAKVHLKATGGMHHPIIEQERYKNNLGFLNFATAVVMRRAIKDLDVTTIQRCLDERDPKAFAFNQGLRWDDFSIPVEELQKIKDTYRMSIGSCSLREPDEDLVRLFRTRA